MYAILADFVGLMLRDVCFGDRFPKSDELFEVVDVEVLLDIELVDLIISHFKKTKKM